MCHQVYQKLTELSTSIRAKIGALTTGVLLAAILSLTAFHFTAGSAILRERVLAEMSVIAKSRADQIQSAIEQDFERVALITSRTRLRECLLELVTARGGTTTDRMNRILVDAQNAVASVRLIEVMLVDGYTVASTDPATVGTMCTDLELLAAGRNGFALGPVYPMETGLCYDIYGPLFDPSADNTEVIGVARAQVPATRLFTILSDRTGLGRSGEILLGTDRDGEIHFINPPLYAGADHNTVVPGQAPGCMAAMALALAGKTGTCEDRDYRNVKALNSYRPVPLGRWGLVAKIDRAEALAPGRRLGVRMLLTGALILAISFAGVLRVAKAIGEPIRELQAGTDIMASGNLRHRVAVRGNDEIGQLARALNAMGANLQRITASRDELDREIAERVATGEQLRLTAAALAQSNEELRNFAQIASHDLQEPLRAVAGFSKLLSERYKGRLDTQADEFIDFINTGAERARQLIHDLLLYSRVETKGKPFVETSSDEVLQEVLNSLKFAIEEQQAQIQRQPLPIILADPGQLAQVFQNLIANAMRFHRPQCPPEISIQARDQDDMWEFRVADNGIGIDPQFHDRIFVIFQQLGERAEGGTGIGLAICKKIVERHGGTIRVESEPGHGATFIFTIPHQPCQPTPEERSS